MKKVFDGMVRSAHWMSSATAAVSCPRCNTAMEQGHHPYVVIAEVKRERDRFICGTDAGYFCPHCPTVVLISSRIEEMLEFSLGSRRFRYSIEGIVDLEAIPPEKRHMELGTDENPIPLVPFRNRLPMRKAHLSKGAAQK